MSRPSGPNLDNELTHEKRVAQIVELLVIGAIAVVEARSASEDRGPKSALDGEDQ